MARRCLDFLYANDRVCVVELDRNETAGGLVLPIRDEGSNVTVDGAAVDANMGVEDVRAWAVVRGVAMIDRSALGYYRLVLVFYGLLDVERRVRFLKGFIGQGVDVVDRLYFTFLPQFYDGRGGAI